MPREPPSQELFPGAALDGKPARWRDLELKQNRLKKMVQGANAQLLCAGWRLGHDREWWVVRHRILGIELRSFRLGELVGRALAFEAPRTEQLEL